MSEEKNFGYLGVDFQQSLIKLLVEDKKFAATILDVLDPHYFDGASFRFIVQNIKELYHQYGEIPGYGNILIKINEENKDDTMSKMNVDTLTNIQLFELTGPHQIKDKALNFCKQQVLKRELKVVQSIIDRGDFDSYKEIEKIIQNALRVGVNTDNVKDVFDDVRAVIQKDARTPIATGIDGLDSYLRGGLGICELGVVLAPTGVGKTTLLTLFANTAYNHGFKVLQIIFEDNINSILRKHYTIWTDVRPDELPDEADAVVEMLSDIEKNSKGQLRICKLPSDSVTISEIKAMLRKLAIEGFSPDLVLIDYVDCISTERKGYGEEWKGEGSIMRQLESMTDEFNIAIWAATQGNRESISSEIVTTNLMGGSIKKAQIAHVVLTVGKTLEQRENNMATFTLAKSRVGPDGVVWQNCQFNNELLKISTDEQVTMLGFEKEVEKRNKQRAIDVYKERKKRELEGITDALTFTAEPTDAIKPNTSFDDQKTHQVHENTISEAKIKSNQARDLQKIRDNDKRNKLKAQEKERLKAEKALEESTISN